MTKTIDDKKKPKEEQIKWWEVCGALTVIVCIALGTLGFFIVMDLKGEVSSLKWEVNSQRQAICNQQKTIDRFNFNEMGFSSPGRNDGIVYPNQWKLNALTEEVEELKSKVYRLSRRSRRGLTDKELEIIMNAEKK